MTAKEDKMTTNEEILRAFAETLKDSAEAERKEWERQRALGHIHTNILAEHLKPRIFAFAMKEKFITKCECGEILVLKSHWLNGRKIEVKIAK